MGRRRTSTDRGRKVASIEDVAQAAGVSTATVSRVINTPDLVSPETTERVRLAIAQLGYRPNLFAQGLMTRKSRVIGLALPDIHGEFYSEMIRGADAEARRRGYHLLVSSESPLEGVPEEGNGRSLAFGLVDGLALMISEPNDRLWREAREYALPVVVMDLELDQPGVDCVMVDNQTGTDEATAHLLQGTPASRLYFVGGPESNFDTRQRADSFVRALRRSAHAARADQTSFGRYTVDWGRQWADAMMKAGTLRGAGVLAGNDEIALGILQGAAAHGVTVPGELRVVGFDDTRLASVVRPALSSVRVPSAEVGAMSVACLAERIEEPERAARKMKLSTNLIVRESSAAG
jgi:LacI family transcriptional regulator